MRGTLEFIVSPTEMVRIAKRHTGEMKERGKRGDELEASRPPVENVRENSELRLTDLPTTGTAVRKLN
jgi:hypothetical protein